MIAEWIDVKDKLPKDMQQVLIAHKEGGVMQADYQERWVKCLPPKGGFKPRFVTPYGDETYDIDDPHPQITHWMPLPVSPTMQAHYANSNLQPLKRVVFLYLKSAISDCTLTTLSVKQ